MGSRKLLFALLWLLRGYSALVVVWTLLSWFTAPLLIQLRNLIGYAVIPAVNVFSFAGFGPLSLAPALVVLVCMGFERLILNQLAKDDPPPERVDPDAS